jgi:hypothetical protein
MATTLVIGVQDWAGLGLTAPLTAQFTLTPGAVNPNSTSGFAESTQPWTVGVGSWPIPDSASVSYLKLTSNISGLSSVVFVGYPTGTVTLVQMLKLYSVNPTTLVPATLPSQSTAILTAAATDASTKASAAQAAAIAASEPVGLSAGTSAAIAAVYARSPKAYLDPRDFSNGPVTALSAGTFSASFGNTPAVINNGSITHTPTTGGGTACYIQAVFSSQPRRIGMIADWGTTGQGSIALVLPSTSWAAGITQAGVHVVVTAGGGVSFFRYTSGGNQGTVGASIGALTGQHTIDVQLDERTSQIDVFVDSVRVVTTIDPAAFTLLSNFAIWELYESNGVGSVPAKMLSTWASTEQRIPTSGMLVGPKRADTTSYAKYATGSWTWTVPASQNFIQSSALAMQVVMPPSGLALGILSIVATVANDSNILVQPINGQAVSLAQRSATEAVASATNRYTVLSVITGTPGQTVTHDWYAFSVGAGVSSLLTGGAQGSAISSFIPLGNFGV